MSPSKVLWVHEDNNMSCLEDSIPDHPFTSSAIYFISPPLPWCSLSLGNVSWLNNSHWVFSFKNHVYKSRFYSRFYKHSCLGILTRSTLVSKKSLLWKGPKSNQKIGYSITAMLLLNQWAYLAWQVCRLNIFKLLKTTDVFSPPINLYSIFWQYEVTEQREFCLISSRQISMSPATKFCGIFRKVTKRGRNIMCYFGTFQGLTDQYIIWQYKWLELWFSLNNHGILEQKCPSIQSTYIKISFF